MTMKCKKKLKFGIIKNIFPWTDTVAKNIFARSANWLNCINKIFLFTPKICIASLSN